MSKQSDHNHTNTLLKRGVTEIIVKSEFERLINHGDPLRLKMGFDPSAPDLHLGHAVGLRKLRQLQDLGHKVVVIVGDWTAQIGDPSGQSVTRPMLTEQEVQKNAETYLSQFYKIVDPDRTETRMQSEWFGPFKMSDVIKLTGKFTVAQFLAREDFAKRFKNNHPITITELLYPILQAYDSVAIESDVEFGGTDQMFNLLVGRELQGILGHNRQQCFMMPILVGTDGIQKMSKSLDNYIGVEDSPKDMFGKIMSLPDEQIIPYLEYLTDTSMDEIEDLKRNLLKNAMNPMGIKKNLAHHLTTDFHNIDLANDARDNFERVVQGRGLPQDIPEYSISNSTQQIHLLLKDSGIVSSNGEAKRLINQNAVEIIPISGSSYAVDPEMNELSLSPGDVIKVGKRRFIRLI